MDLVVWLTSGKLRSLRKEYPNFFTRDTQPQRVNTSITCLLDAHSVDPTQVHCMMTCARATLADASAILQQPANLLHPSPVP